MNLYFFPGIVRHIMQSIRRIGALLAKEWVEFFQGKAWVVVLVMPLFIGFLYAVVYREAETERFQMAHIGPLRAELRQLFKNGELQLIEYANNAAARMALTQGKVDGVLLWKETGNELTLLVDKTRSRSAVMLVNALNAALVTTYSRPDIPQIKLIYANPAIPVRWLSLPTWLIQVLFFIGLLQVAAAVADEKDRQTLNSLIISPLHYLEYIVARVCWYALVALAAVVCTLLFTGARLNLPPLIIFTLLGGCVFAAAGVLIGIACPNPLFARTVATLAYILGTIPIMLRDLSLPFQEALASFPSLMILNGLESSLQKGATYLNLLPFFSIVLLSETGLLLLISYLLLKFKLDL
jgi:hypothetical protein